VLYLKQAALLLAAVALAGLGALDALNRDGEPTIVYIVRHAEKKSGDQLSQAERKDDRKVDLLPEGYARAEVLAWMLRDVDLDAVYSTDFKRTRMTVKPAAEGAKLSVRTLESNPARAASMLRTNAQAGKTLLICGHSNTIPALLEQIGVEIPEKILSGYDDLFVVVLGRDEAGEVSNAMLQRLHYPGTR
jgi:broad specificity phosphatase PhoE